MRPLQSDDLFAFRLAGDVQVCPASDLVIYVETKADQDTNDYVSRLMAARPGSAPFPFTQGPHDSHPRFSPDGKRLAFLSKRSGHSQIWSMPVTGGEAAQVTRIRGEITEFIWTRDSRRLVFVAEIGPEGLEYEGDEPATDPYRRYTEDVRVITELGHKLDGVGFYTDRRPHILIQTADQDALPERVTHGPYRHAHPAIDATGRFLLATSRYGEDYDRHAFDTRIYLFDLLNPGPPEAVTPDYLSATRALFHPDGTRIVFSADRVEDMGYDNATLYEVPLVGGAERNLVAEWDRPLDNVALTDMPLPAGDPFVFSADGRALFALTGVNGTTRLVRIDLDAQQSAPAVLTNGDEVVASFAVSDNARRVALAVTSAINPARILWMDLDDGTVLELANPNQELLATLDLSTPQRFSFESFDGQPVEGWVMKPVGYLPGERYPAVLEIHGGPMMMYASSFYLEFQRLAAAGYGVVYTNPRGSQGYGREFCRAIRFEWGNLDYQDIMAGLDVALAQNPWIDEERLAVAGGSYGGYMTNWIIGHSDRFKAAITMRSVVDWRAMMGTGDGGPEWTRRAGAPPWREDEWYRQQSPITYVDNMRTPLLIEHQENDLRCPIEQAEILYTALKFLDQAPVKFIRYPGESHGMSRDGKPWHRVYRLDSLVEWLNRFCRPPAE